MLTKSFTVFLVCAGTSVVFCAQANAWWSGVTVPTATRVEVGVPSGMAEQSAQQPRPEIVRIQSLATEAPTPPILVADPPPTLAPLPSPAPLVSPPSGTSNTTPFN